MLNEHTGFESVHSTCDFLGGTNSGNAILNLFILTSFEGREGKNN